MKSQLLKALWFTVILFIMLTSCKKEETTVPENMTETEVTSSRSGEKIVPFKGTYTTTVEILSAPPVLHQRITGLGQATHLGASKFVALSALDVRTNLLSGTAIFDAANGDEFYTSFTGSATPFVNNVRTVINHHTLTGGTGRFEDATGTFTGISVVTLGSPTNTITYDGSISY